ncbi:MAG: serine protease [Myxococcota bacterium]
MALFAAATHAEEPGAADLFSRHKDRVFQVRVVDREAENKSSLGTGFLVAEDRLVATNYHVISQFVDYPERYRLEYLDQAGKAGALTLLDVDVVHDLALLRTDDPMPAPLELAETPPEQGVTIYSLGNPFDIGFTVVPGTYNGIDRGSYYEHIHFSGSINSGMSGGPVLDRQGRVVGVNVSTAGNQVSFLVPSKALGRLIGEWRDREGAIESFRERIRDQLFANQERFMARLLAEEWPEEEMASARAIGELKPFVKCWGSSSEPDALYKSISNLCASDQGIFLRSGFNTGVLAYQFIWLEAHELEAPRFQTQYQSVFESFRPDNVAGEDDAGDFVCDESFITDERGHTDKTVLCIRAYREYEELFDALFIRGSVDTPRSAYMSHFTLAGMSRASIERFLERFLEAAGR